MAWRVARGLNTLNDQIKGAYWWAAPPATPAASWGSIGDPRTHSASSDHMPHNFPGWASEVVTARDFPHRPDLGLSMGPITEALRLSRDNRIKYVIFNRRVFSSYPSGSRPAWVWGTYAGSNPHTDHAHVSSVGDARADGQHPWQIGEIDMATAPEIAAAVVEALKADPNFQSLIWRTRSIGQMADPIPNTMEPGEENKLAQAVSAILAAVQTPVEVVMTAEQLATLADDVAARLRVGTAQTVAEVVNATRLSVVPGNMLDPAAGVPSVVRSAPASPPLPSERA